MKLSKQATHNIIMRGDVKNIHKMITNDLHHDSLHLYDTVEHLHALNTNRPVTNEIYRHLLQKYSNKMPNAVYHSIAAHSDHETRKMMLGSHFRKETGDAHYLMAREAWYDGDKEQYNHIMNHPDINDSVKSEIVSSAKRWWKK